MNKINCNGAEIRIQPNLWLALRQIRHRTLRRVIWADALCINQSDDQERAQQVQTMTSIYSNASRTLIWLGMGSHRTTYAFELVGRLVNNWDEDKPAHFWTVDENSGEKTLHRPSGISTDWQYLADMFKLSWFRRKWVIQEVALSRSALMLWGNCEMSWCWIGLAAAIMRTQRNNIVKIFGMFGVYDAYLMFRLSRHGGLPAIQLTFLQLLRLTSRFQTSDPRDTIFAILGLETKDHHPRDAPFIVADYSVTAEALFAAVAEKFLHQHHPLKFLTNFFDDERVLDSALGEGSGAMLSPWSLENSFSPAEGLPFERFPSGQPSILAIRGIKVATVMFCGSSDGVSIAQLMNSGAFGNFSKDSLALFARTLTAGRNEYGSCEKNRTALVPHFAAYLKYHVENIVGPENLAQIEEAAEGGDEEQFTSVADNVRMNRPLFVTTSGHIGLGPSSTLPGDIVCVLGGADMPFVIRKADNRFRLIGECYVDDIMNGEAVEAVKMGRCLQGPFDVANILKRLFRFENVPKTAGEMSKEVKRDVIDLACKEYETLRESCIEIY